MSALEKFDDGWLDDQIICEALTSLIKQGIDFIPEATNDGQTEYVISGIRFTAEEIRRLQEQGALTRTGIQHYLVSR